MLRRVVVRFAVYGRPLRRPVVRGVPIRLAEVAADGHALPPEGVEHAADDVGARVRVERAVRVRHAVVGGARVPHAEAVMVLCGEGDVLHARRPRSRGPGVGVEIHRAEGAVQRPVVPLEPLQVAPALRPAAHAVGPRPGVLGHQRPALAAVPLAVGPPVEEDPEPLVHEPLKPPLQPLRLRRRRPAAAMLDDIATSGGHACLLVATQSSCA